MGYNYEAGKMLPRGHLVNIGDTRLSADTIDRVATTILSRYADAIKKQAEKDGIQVEIPEEAPTSGTIEHKQTVEFATVQRGDNPQITYSSPREFFSINTFRAVRRTVSLVRNTLGTI
jgi:hypothetical protein